LSKFIGRRVVSSTATDGYSDHGLLPGLLDDDHPQYLITTAIRDSVSSPTSGLRKTGAGAGDVFSLINAGSGAALFIQQTGAVVGADAAVDIDNTGNTSRGLSVLSGTVNPSLPLVQFTALSKSFDEPLLSLIHADPDQTALQVIGDAYVSSQLTVDKSIAITPQTSNPFTLGETGIYVKDNSPSEFFFVNTLGQERTFTIDTTGGGSTLIATADGYFPFIEVDELTMSGSGSGTIANTSGTATSGSITRRKYNNFAVSDGNLEIKGLTLRSTIDDEVVPTITYSVVKNATLITDNASRTVLTEGIALVEDDPTTETELLSGTRKEGEIQFTTGAIDLTDPKFNTGDSNFDGYLYFIFEGSHTADTKTVIVERLTAGPNIEHIHFTMPICSFTGTPQTTIRTGQSFDVEVTTAIDGYALSTSVQIDAGGAVQSLVSLTETSPGSGIWTGTVVARTGQPNGIADISATAFDLIANSDSADTDTTGDERMVFDNDFPVIESFEEGADLAYPPGQSCLKFTESVDAYMSVTDFTEILYTATTSRFTIASPTVFEAEKTITYDVAPTGIEENADITGAASTDNVSIRARKSSNCSETTRNIQIRIDDTPPAVSTVRWRRDDTGSYDLTSPSLGVGTHGVQVVFDDPLTEAPEFIVQDTNKGTLSVFTGTLPGATFVATLTVSDPSDTDGCTELVLVTGINCSHKLPLASDPISGTDEVFCIDVNIPNILFVDLDVDLIDGYRNDGYDGYNVMNDDSTNLDNTEQACEHNFSSGVQTITASDILTRHNEDVFVTVGMNSTIETGDTCSFDASPWGASASLSVAQLDGITYQGSFATDLGSTRNDDQSRAIGRASLFHATGNDATVTDLATNSDTATNSDELSANGIDDIASTIAFTTDGTSGGVFQVSSDTFRAFMINRQVRIVDDNTSATIRTVRGSELDGSNGTIFCDGGSLAAYTVAQNARAVPLGVTDAEVVAWDANNGIVSYVDDASFTNLTLIDLANPEAFSQHLSNDQITQNNSGTIGVDLFEASFWGSKISVPNTGGGTEANPTGTASSKYVWRSKRIRLTTNPTGIQGTNLRLMVFGFSANTSYRNVNVTTVTDWDQNSTKFNLSNNDSQIDIRISVDDPFAAIPPHSNANWFLTTDSEVSPQAGFKFGKTKDINTVFNPPSNDVIDKDIYIEITLTTNGAGKAPQIDAIALAYLT